MTIVGGGSSNWRDGDDGIVSGRGRFRRYSLKKSM